MIRVAQVHGPDRPLKYLLMSRVSKLEMTFWCMLINLQSQN
jgi:hypothetical protein